MHIPIEIVELRQKYFTSGDNKKVAEIANGLATKNKNRTFVASDVYDVFRRGTGHTALILALKRYYERVQKESAEIFENTKSVNP